MIAIICIPLAGFIGSMLVAPRFLKSAKKAPLTVALSNARQIGLALFDFESEYGALPSEDTIAIVKERNASQWNLSSTTSNDLFKQILVADLVATEEIFYVRQPGTQPPDNFIQTESQALSKGECGFAYIAGGSMNGRPDRPIAVAPLIPGTLTFDPDPFGNKAVILLADNSATTYPIVAGKAVVNGMDLFDPSQPFWEGKKPEVKWPDLVLPKKSHLTSPLIVSADTFVVLFIGWAMYLTKRLTRSNRQSGRNPA